MYFLDLHVADANATTAGFIVVERGYIFAPPYIQFGRCGVELELDKGREDTHAQDWSICTYLRGLCG